MKNRFKIGDLVKLKETSEYVGLVTFICYDSLGNFLNHFVVFWLSPYWKCLTENFENLELLQ